YTDWGSEYEGDPIVNSRQAMSRWIVHAVGPALKVPAAHNKAVAEASEKIQRAQGA
ncbi:hypothetical protein G3I37_22970, partial [Streptomyces anulatus]|nr:hypothetical protein [Streptomyces anulatus]